MSDKNENKAGRSPDSQTSILRKSLTNVSGGNTSKQKPITPSPAPPKK